MATGDFGAVLDSEAFVQAAYQPPTLRKRTKNVVLLNTTDILSGYAYLRSLAISDAGIINTTPLSALTPGPFGGRDMGLIHWLDDVFVLYCNDASANGHLFTVACDDAGAITDPALDDLAVGQGSNVTRRSDLIKPYEGILLTGTSYPYPGVHLQTIAISDAGIMPGPVEDEMDLAVRPRTQRLRQGAGDRIINLASVMAQYYIRSFTCSATGVLPAGATDSWGPISCATDYNNLCKISNTVFATFCMDVGASINIRTFSINADGTINKAWLDEEQVEAGSLAHIHMMELGGGYVIVAYAMAAPNWRLKTYYIEPDGTIQTPAIDTLDRATGNRGNQWLEHLNGNIWTFTYEDSNGSVTIDTIEIDTPGDNITHNELVFGIGP